jgi:ATP-binding cassette subfamily B protein
MRYLGHYRKQALLPYIFLVVATLSMLAVPRLLGNIIDAVMQGYTANTVLEGMEQIPEFTLPQFIPQILEFLNLPADWTASQLEAYMSAEAADAPSAIIIAGIAILIFAVLRGVFAFLQAYWAERNSQDVAFDLRNDLFTKVQSACSSDRD